MYLIVRYCLGLPLCSLRKRYIWGPDSLLQLRVRLGRAEVAGAPGAIRGALQPAAHAKQPAALAPPRESQISPFEINSFSVPSIRPNVPSETLFKTFDLHFSTQGRALRFLFRILFL